MHSPRRASFANFSLGCERLTCRLFGVGESGNDLSEKRRASHRPARPGRTKRLTIGNREGEDARAMPCTSFVPRKPYDRTTHVCIYPGRLGQSARLSTPGLTPKNPATPRQAELPSPICALLREREASLQGGHARMALFGTDYIRLGDVPEMSGILVPHPFHTTTTLSECRVCSYPPSVHLSSLLLLQS
jgi:hypothetical protein